MLSPRLRWKLARLQQRLQAAWDATFQRQPKPRVCFSCGRLVGANEKVCSNCGASQAPLSFSVFKRVSLALIPAESPVTYALLFANLLFFVVAWIISQRSQMNPGLFHQLNTDVLYQLGAKFGYDIVVRGQLWRLVMPIFLHFDIIHFGFNSFVLWQVGPQVEDLFGSARFLFLYLVTGIVGFVASVLWYDMLGRPTLSVGSSGALFGLIGILIAYISQRHGFASEYRRSLIRWAIFIFILGVVLPFDNAAHFGGLVSGLALGRLVSARRPATPTARFLVGLMGWGSAVVILLSVAMVLLHLPATPAR